MIRGISSLPHNWSTSPNAGDAIEEEELVDIKTKMRIAERGAGMAEYALLLVLIAVALIAGFQGLATGISTAVSGVASALN